MQGEHEGQRGRCQQVGDSIEARTPRRRHPCTVSRVPAHFGPFALAFV